MVSDSMIQRSWTEHFVSLLILPLDYASTASKKVLYELVKIHFREQHLNLLKSLPHLSIIAHLRELANIIGIRILQVGEFGARDRKDLAGKKIGKKKAREMSKENKRPKQSKNTFTESYNKIVEALPSASRFSTEWLQSTEFLKSLEWKRARYAALLDSKGACLCCGQTVKSHNAILCVDHIKPRKTHPELALSIGNLQVLCEKCNAGKGNITEDDWRYV